MCNQCSYEEGCRKAFGIKSGCSGTQAATMNRTLNVLKARCGVSTKTEFTGTADCEVLRYIATSWMDECGLSCGQNEYAKVNIDENSIYCACDGKCLQDFTDNTLNSLVGTLIGLLFFQIIFNGVRMINDAYGFSLFSSSLVTPVVGKTV